MIVVAAVHQCALRSTNKGILALSDTPVGDRCVKRRIFEESLKTVALVDEVTLSELKANLRPPSTTLAANVEGFVDESLTIRTSLWRRRAKKSRMV